MFYDGLVRSEPYTVTEIRIAVEINRERLFAPMAVNRPENWACDPRTRDFVCIGNWIDEEMRALGLDDLGRITQNGQFNRRARSEEDMLAIAVTIMNDVLIDRIDRNRRPHRRWG